MAESNDPRNPSEQDAQERLKQAYIEDLGLPEDLAAARAAAESRRMEGKSDHKFDARGKVDEKRGGFENDRNKPETS